MLFLLLAQEQTLRPVTHLSRLLAGSAERLRRWAVPRAPARARRDAERTVCIERRHLASRGIGGSARIPSELTLGPGIACGRKRVPSSWARRPSRSQRSRAIGGRWPNLPA